MAFYEMLPGAGTTPITPTLITKTITENGTYSAEYDGADGYSEVTVNVPTIGNVIVHEGKLNIVNGTISADSNWYYTDTFDCPTGYVMIDIGEASNDAGLELVYAADDSHANYWNASTRYRVIDVSSNYSATKKARFTFKKEYLSSVIFMDIAGAKIYSNTNVAHYSLEE